MVQQCWNKSLLLEAMSVRCSHNDLNVFFSAIYGQIDLIFGRDLQVDILFHLHPSFSSVLSCHAMPCHVMAWHDMTCHVCDVCDVCHVFLICCVCHVQGPGQAYTPYTKYRGPGLWGAREDQITRVEKGPEKAKSCAPEEPSKVI
jgi:hypothetical protein